MGLDTSDIRPHRDHHLSTWLGLVLLTLFAALPATVNASPEGFGGNWIKAGYQRSFRLESLGSYNEAIEALDTIREAYPRGYAINLRLGWLHYLRGNDTTSETHYRTAITVSPESIEAHLGLMLPLLAQGRWQAAESVAMQILQIDPYNYYGNLRLCIALRQQKKFELAKRQAEKLVAHYPADTLFLKELALSLQGLGEIERGASLLRDVETLTPTPQ